MSAWRHCGIDILMDAAAVGTMNAGFDPERIAVHCSTHGADGSVYAVVVRVDNSQCEPLRHGRRAELQAMLARSGLYHVNDGMTIADWREAANDG